MRQNAGLRRSHVCKSRPALRTEPALFIIDQVERLLVSFPTLRAVRSLNHSITSLHPETSTVVVHHWLQLEGVRAFLNRSLYLGNGAFHLVELASQVDLSIFALLCIERLADRSVGLDEGSYCCKQAGNDVGHCSTSGKRTISNGLGYHAFSHTLRPSVSSLGLDDKRY